MLNNKSIAALAASASLLSGLAVATPALADSFSDSVKANAAYVNALNPKDGAQKVTPQKLDELKKAASQAQKTHTVDAIANEKQTEYTNKLKQVNQQHQDGNIPEQDANELAGLKKAADKAKLQVKLEALAQKAENEGLSFTAKQIRKANTLSSAEALLKAAEEIKAEQNKKENGNEGNGSLGYPLPAEGSTTPATPETTPAAPEASAAPVAPASDETAAPEKVDADSKKDGKGLPQTGEADVAGLLTTLSTLFFGAAGAVSLKKRH